MSLKIYELSLPQSKKNKPLALNTVNKETNDQIDDDTLQDEEFAYLIRKL